MKFLKKKSGSDSEPEQKTVPEEAAENGEKKAAPLVKKMLLGGGALLLLLLCIWIMIGFMGKSETAKKDSHDKTAQTEDKSSAKENTAQDSHAKKTDQPPAKPAASPPKKTVSGTHSPTVSPSFTGAGREVGITFVEACIRPMNHELNERFWGWRPNDIINVTDNVNSFQLGVLEVTRRTSVALAENISRTGGTAAYVPALELAMNWFMVKPSQYWFPSAESKYQEGLDELRNYMEMLKRGEASFYRRVDNVVPLFKAYESILGSCDENLVKDLGKLSFSKADDYFYYTKGVATAMGIILEAAAVDFSDLIASAQGADVMHHAIVSLEHAAHMSPWLVLESKPDSLLANHRANMAAPISHARFYLGVLNTALTGNI